MSLLQGPFWLNDQVIAFYFQYLESSKFKGASDKILFVSPQVTQLLKMSEKSEWSSLLDPLRPGKKLLIFFAVNDNESPRSGGTHWSLLVYSRLHDTFFSFDSLNNFNNVTTRKLYHILRNALGLSEANLQTLPCANQSNGYDCGIHLLANVENICDFFLDRGDVENVPVLNFRAVANKRQEILALIKQLGGNL